MSGPSPNEPLLFYLPFAKPLLVEDLPSMPGGAEVGTICATTLHLPGTASLLPALQALVSSGVVAVEPAQTILVDFEHVAGASEIIDLRSKLPVRFRPAALVRAPGH